MWEMATGCVAVEDLEDAEVDSSHGVEDALAPGVAHSTAQGKNHGCIEEVRDFSLPLPQRGP
jgi:hypothetical protein